MTPVNNARFRPGSSPQHGGDGHCHVFVSPDKRAPGYEAWWDVPPADELDALIRIFFKGDSWQFSNSSTLIRLFPERFWFDAVVSIGVLTLVGALAAIVIGWAVEQRALCAAYR